MFLRKVSFVTVQVHPISFKKYQFQTTHQLFSRSLRYYALQKELGLAQNEIIFRS